MAKNVVRRPCWQLVDSVSSSPQLNSMITFGKAYCLKRLNYNFTTLLKDFDYKGVLLLVIKVFKYLGFAVQ